MGKKMTIDEFIKRAREKHGDKYDYSKVDLNHKDEFGKIIVICPKHGEFKVTVDKHLNRGDGCKECYKEKKVKHNSITKEEFIRRAREKHGDRFDYSLVEFTKYNSDIVKIICKEHGLFEYRVNLHIRFDSGGCPECSKLSKIKSHTMSKEEFIRRAREKHGDKYDYSKVDLLNKDENDKITVICPIHGEFKVTVDKHLGRGDGCRKCGIIRTSSKQKFTNEDFIKRAREVHGDKYDYSKVNYVDYNTNVIIICPIHGEFLQTPDSHLQGSGCQKCSVKISKNESELSEFVKSKIDCEIRNRNILHGKELDIFIPSKNIGIEYNGVRWHSELFNYDKDYHLNKTIECNNQGIKLIQIFEDEYILHKDIVLNKINHILGLNNNLPKIMGRKCDIVELDNTTSKVFLNEYHIQGFIPSTIYLGALYNGELVAVMTFKEVNEEWELTRFASDYHYVCQGIGSKLFNFFIKKYNPKYIKSFADRRWTIDKDNNLYTKLGFKLEEILKPDYRYYDSKNCNINRYHKFNFRKDILHKKYNLPLSMTESEMTKELGYYKIWDCGLFKFVWKNG